MKSIRIISLIALAFAALILFGIIPGISVKWAYAINIAILLVIILNKKEFRKDKD